MLHAKSLSGIFYLASSGIKTPKDLAGRFLADVAGGAVLATFPAFAAENGIDVNKVKIVTMAASAKLPSLISGKVDSSATYALAIPALRRVGKKLASKSKALCTATMG